MTVSWRSWAYMPEGEQLLVAYDSEDHRRAVEQEVRRHNATVTTRIAWLEGRLNDIPREDLAEAHHVLAELHERLPHESSDRIYARSIRFHCMRSLRLEPGNARAWALLGFCLDCLITMGSMTGTPPEPIITGPNDCGEPEVPAAKQDTVWMSNPTRLRFARRAVRCLARAHELEPSNDDYTRWLGNARSGLRCLSSSR